MTPRKTSSSVRSYASRRRAACRQAGAKVRSRAFALLVSRPEDVSYLAGFTGDDSCLLIGRRWACLLTDGRYREQAETECHGVGVHVRCGAMSAAAAEVARARQVRVVGVQADHLTVASREALAGALGKRRRVVSASGSLRRQRAVKDQGEVAAIRRAVRVAQDAMKAVMAGGAKAWIGRTERSLAAELDHRMRLGGASAPAFETIVATGANSSRPHYRPGATKIARGGAVLIDWGAKVGGYCSDLTRVVFVGTILPKLGEIYEVVLRAQSAGASAVRPGAACRSADAAARKVIADAGYGEAFVHGLGHGIGREVHELPVLARTAETRLRRGAVVTVEPGIYLPGVGGVRIEDDVLVTAKGHRWLSSLPKSLDAMTLR